MPATHLINTDLPAPLSPASAVTFPAGTSRVMSTRACTGPKFLSMPTSRSSGPASGRGDVSGCGSDSGVTPVPLVSAEGRVDPVTPYSTSGNDRVDGCELLDAQRVHCSSYLLPDLLNAGRRARVLQLRNAQGGDRYSAVLDDSLGHVLRGHPQRGKQDRCDVGFRGVVRRLAVDQGGGNAHARPQVERHRCSRL